MLTAVAITIIGLAFLMMVGTVVYGILWAVVDGVVSLLGAARGVLSKREVISRPEIASQPSELSTESLWHRMQGTSKRERRRSSGS